MVNADNINLFNEAIRKVSSYDFSEYSEKSFGRRITKILTDYKLDLHELISKIAVDKIFLEQVIKDITVNTTELFRDPHIWQSIKYRVLNKFKNKEQINIWHAGCSTGQEIYSMLILLNELDLIDKANIYATDINTDVIDKAINGEYLYRFNIEYIDNFRQVIQENPYNYEEIRKIPFSKYFEIDNIKDIMRIKPFLKDKAVFRKHDLVKEENVFGIDFDIILCRNVIIYFKSKLQDRLFKMFSESLKRKGFLILGMHESILGPESSKFIKHGYFYIKK